MCARKATTTAAARKTTKTTKTTSGNASADLIDDSGYCGSSSRPSWLAQGQRLNLRIFKLLISCCALMCCIYTNAWQLSILGQLGVMAGSIKGRGETHRLDEIGAGSLTRSWLTQSNNHANISELLDNLLRGYDNSIRPDFGGKLAKKEGKKKVKLLINVFNMQSKNYEKPEHMLRKVKHVI